MTALHLFPRLAPAFVAATLAAPAFASFHLMQVEQIIGGVAGDPTKQAIQLRMRQAGQSFVSGTVIKVFDAQGLNPITVATLTSNVPISTAGSRILIASPNFLSATSPATTADFAMTALIPSSYLAAGRLTFEGGGQILWSVSWGGAAYTGPQTGSAFNDADGNFGPAFAGPLPSASVQALRFTGAFSALSTNNAANYALTPAAATFSNNANASFTVVEPPPPACPADFDGSGVVDPDDLADFIAGFFSSPPDPRTDVNADGTIDPDDLADFIATFFGPPC